MHKVLQINDSMFGSLFTFTYTYFHQFTILWYIYTCCIKASIKHIYKSKDNILYILYIRDIIYIIYVINIYDILYIYIYVIGYSTWAVAWRASV